MDEKAVIKEFEDADAVLRGHFLLSSGLHSDTYIQCARALIDAKRAERLCSALAEEVRKTIGKNTVDIIVSPAMGGVVVGYEMGRQLGIPAIFCERVDGYFALRRGFSIEEDARILIVEDVVTTGKSSLETVECTKGHGGKVIAEACLINRSGESNPLGDIPLIALAELDIQTYEENALPPELQDIPAVKPGSRDLNQK